MKTRLSLALLFAAVMFCSLQASAAKLNVKVHPTTSECLSSGDINRIHAQILAGLANIPTVNLLDESNDGTEADEHFQCNIDSINVYKKGKGADAHYITCINMRATVYNDPEHPEHAWSIPVQVFSSLLLATHKTTKESATSALEWVPSKVLKELWEPFAVTGKLLEVTEVKNDKAQMVSAAIGTLNGAEPKQSLDVYLPDPKIVDKDGQLKENKPIGKVKIEDVGEDVSVCKVTKGGDKIYAAYIEDPNQLTVKSKAPSEGTIKDLKYKAQTGAEFAFILNEILKGTVEIVNESIGFGKEVVNDVKSIF